MLAGSDVLVSVEGSHITAKVASAIPVAAGSTASGAATAAPDLRNSAMAAGDVYSLAIRHTGSIQASNVLINGGGGQVRISGSIDASSHTAGAVGGNVAITGGEVDLVSADINASGPAGGGSVEIGGGAHGSGDLPHAQIVSVDSNSTIDADATSNGSGGSIALWSDGTTSDAAVLTARGGPLGGDGGYIETSGYYLQVSAAPNASAIHGNAGTWVMDPIDITIANGTGTGTFTGPTVFNADIDAALNGGTSVVIDTSNQTNGLDTGTLVQNSDAIISVTPTSNVTLTLRANDNMTLSGGITASGTSTLSVELDQLNSAGSAVTINTNPININGTFKVVGGNLSLASGIGLTASGVTIGSGTVVADSGSVTVTMGSIALDGPVNTGGGTFAASGASFENDAAISDGGSNPSNNPFTVNTSSGAGTININGAISWAGTGGVDIEGGAGVGTTAAGTITSEGSAAVPVSLFTTGTSSGNGVTVSGTVNTNGVFTASGGAFTLSANLTANSASIDLASSTTLDSKAVTSTTVTINEPIHATASTGQVLVGGSSFSSTATTGTITTTDGNVTITNSGGTAINAAVVTGGGKFSATGGSGFTTNAGGTINTAGTTNGEVDISSTGTISIGDTITTGSSSPGGGIFIDFGNSGSPVATHGGPVSIGAAITTDGGVFSSGGTTFTSTSAGVITTSGGTGGNVTISTTGVVLIQASVNTGGGAFAVTGTGFANDTSISNGVATGTTAFTVNTSSGTGTIDINGAIAWSGSGGVDIEGGGGLGTTAAGTITSSGTSAMPVSLFTTGVASGNGVTVGGTVNTNGVFTASGGAFTLSADLTANSASINLAANTTLDSKPVTSTTVAIDDPIASVGQVLVGGTSFTSETTTGTIAIADGNLTITNSLGTTINASVATGGGTFSATGGSGFTTNAGGTLNTTGTTNGEVDISSSGAISIGDQITTGTTGVGGGIFIDYGNSVSPSPTHGGPISIGAAVSTHGGAFSAGGTTFTSTPAGTGTVVGTITTAGGKVIIATTGAILIGAEVNTGGGGFVVTAGGNFENDAAITDGGTNASNNPFTVNTSSSAGTININGAISWAGTGGVDIEGSTTVSNSASGTITSEGSAAVPVSLYTTGIGSNNGITVGGAVNTNGAFTASGAVFTLSEALTANSASINLATTTVIDGKTVTPSTTNINEPVAITSTTATVGFQGGGTIFTSSATGTITSNGGSVSITPTVSSTLGGAVSTGGGAFAESGGLGFTTSIGATISTSGGNVTINTTGPEQIGAAVTTGAGSFSATGGTSFTSTSGGTITTTDGSVNIGSTGTDTIGAAISTGGGAFVATGTGFENDAGISIGVTTSNAAFTVTTTGTGSIDINGAIAWAGSGGVTITGAEQVVTTTAGTITSAGTTAMPVSLFSTVVQGSLGTTGVTIGGGVTTSGPFVASGGNFILQSGIALTAPSVSLNLATTTPAPSSQTVTPGTIAIGGPIDANGGAGGAVDIGGIILLTDNGTGTITTNGGPVAITNTGLVGLGNAVVTAGGSFSVTGADSFSTTNAPITTSGGSVTISTSTTDGIAIATGSPVNTGGGSFTATAQTFENESTISDGGAATGTGSLTIDTTSGTGADALNSAITWTGGTGRSVVIEGGGDVTIGGIASAGPAALPVSIFTTGAGNTVSISGPVSTTGAFVSSGGTFSVASTGSVAAQTAAINIATAANNSKPVTPGAVSIAGPVTTNAGVFTAGGTSFTSSGTGSITTNGGDVDLLTAGDVTVGAAINTGGGDFNAANDSAFTSSPGGTITTVGGAVTIDSTGEVNIGDEINTGGGSFTASGTTFTSSGEITDGGVNDAQGLSITTTEGDITLNTGGDINWSASLAPIAFVMPSGSNLDLGATIAVNPAEALNFTGFTVSLVETTSTISGGNITFGSIVNPGSATSPALTVQSAGAVSFTAAVGTSASPIGTLTVTANGSSVEPVTTLSGSIFTIGNVDFGGSVVLAANVAITVVDPNGTADHDIEFDSTIEGPQGLTITLGNQNTEQVRFNSNVGDQTPLAFLDVNSNVDGFVFFRGGLPTATEVALPGIDDPQPATVVDIATGGNFEVSDVVPSPKRDSNIVATIDSYGPLTINIGSASSPNAANLFAVGQYEKLTTYGGLTINTNGGTAQVGDLSSFGNLTLDAANIVFLLRQPTFENNRALDEGVDLIANGEMSLPANAAYSAISPSGSGAFGIPGFIARSFDPNSNIAAIASSLKTAISIVPSIPATAFFLPGGVNLLLDLTPSTLGSRLPTFIPPIPFVFDLPVGGAVPRQQLVAGTVASDLKDALMPGYPGPIVQQDLKDDGIFTREPSLEEIVAATDSIVDYNDTPRKRRPRAEDFAVVVNRVDSSRAQKFLDKYHEMFSGGAGVSPDMPSRRAQIAGDLQEAWDAYVGQNGYKQATGAGFQQYVAATPSALKVSTELVQLNSLLQQLDTLGLSHKEAQMLFQHNVLAGLSANGMQDNDLIGAVESAGNVK
jgi:hypothetical protein